MKRKKKHIYITGVESDSSGAWDWVTTKSISDRLHADNIKNFSNIKGEIIYRGELDVPNGSNDEITKYVENYLMENGFEDSPLINKEIVSVKV